MTLLIALLLMESMGNLTLTNAFCVCVIWMLHLAFHGEGWNKNEGL
jgi:hypothetical protein